MGYGLVDNYKNEAMEVLQALCDGKITLNQARNAVGLVPVSDAEFDQRLGLKQNLTNIKIELHGRTYNENHSCRVFTDDVNRILECIKNSSPD